MTHFSTDAILLRKIEYGDHDFIISFLTRTKGRISVIAKNAKQSVKRFSGAMDLFSVNQIHCVYPKKKKDGMIILCHADLENGMGNIRYDVLKTALAGFWVELVHFFLEEEKALPRLYDLLFFSLDALNTGVISGEVIHLLFLIRFMALSGFEPNIEFCGCCQTPVDLIDQKRVLFDFKDGRIVCKKCIKGESKYSRTVSKGTLKQLFWINKNDVSRMDRIRFSALALKEGESLLESFIPFHIGREFKSLQFLKRLRQET